MIEIDETFTVAAPPDEVYKVLSDPHAVVECVQGAALGETHEDGTFDGFITIKFSALRIKFTGVVGLDLDEPNRRGTMTASGKDGQGGTKFNVAAEFAVHAGENDRTSVVTAKGDVNLRGKLASVIENAASAVVERMTADFVDALSMRCASGATVLDAGSPDGGDDTAEAGTPGRSRGVLLLHGFGGSPITLRGWGERLAADGVAVGIPRLAGHGTRWKDLDKKSWDDWYANAASALDQLVAEHDVVLVMGISLGATLALRLAQQRGKDVRGVVAVNPVISGLTGISAWDNAFRFIRRSRPAVANDIKKAGGKDVGYDRLPLRAAASLRAAGAMVAEDLRRIDVPVLVVNSATDHVVPTEDGETVYRGLRQPVRSRLILKDSYHVAPLDNDADLLASESVEFVRTAGHAERAEI